LVNINSYGFRSKYKTITKKVDSKRILLFGDSEVFGVGVDEGSMLDVLMEKLLNEDNKFKYEIVNLGMPNLGTLAQEKLFEIYKEQFDPDAIIFIVTTANDLSDNVLYSLKQKGIDHHSLGMELPSEKPKLYLIAFAKWQLIPLLAKYGFFRKTIMRIFKPSKLDLPHYVREWYEGKWLKEGLPLMTGAVSRINEKCKKENIDMIIASIPCRVQFNKGYKEIMELLIPENILKEINNDKDRPQRIIEELCNKNSIHYIEVLDKFIYLSQKENIILKHPRDGHLNKRGTLEISKILAEGIKKIYGNNF
ncbi:SGNH/GDSL hydrolase family protein, partial [Acidobacteriota bacterium]